MPYQIAQDELNNLGGPLADYYEEAWQLGVKGLFDKMARSNMGLVTARLDMASDTFTNLKKKSSDSFFTTFKPALRQQVGLYFANKNDVASDLVTVAEKVLNYLAGKIPVPYVGTAISTLTSFAAAQGQKELHQRSIGEADGQLTGKTGNEVQKFFTTDVEAEAFIKKSIDEYKTIGKFIETLPKTISTFDEAVTFPGSHSRCRPRPPA